MSRVKEGQLSEESLLRLLRTVQQDAPSSFPTSLRLLLEEVEGKSQEPPKSQSGGKSEFLVCCCYLCRCFAFVHFVTT